MNDEPDITQLTADVVSAYVANNAVPQTEIPALITSVHSALAGSDKEESDSTKATRPPAVPIRRSVSPEYLVCLEDGKKFKSMKRHLRTNHDMTPEQYRHKWGLKSDYPMVAPHYAEQRSAMAKKMGLGQGKRKK